jgi:16S rRNA (guanine527-N7)-methyltransferase
VKRALREYCDLLAAAPVSVTGVHDLEEIWRLHVEDALTALPVIERMAPRSVVDVGSGGGSPGIPIAIATGLAVALVESRAPKAAFLRRTVARLGLACEVLHQRSEDLARGRGRDAWDLALARALAPPPAAAELCLPLVRSGGHVLLWTANLDAAGLAAAAGFVAGDLAEIVATAGARSLALIEKTGPTPERYPRRPGVARRRPPGSIPSTG